MELTASTEVTLWDGRSYCRKCVDGALPGLADYAIDHPILIDTTAFSLPRIVQASLLVMLLLFVSTLIILSIGFCGVMGAPPDGLGLFVLPALFCGLFFFILPFVVALCWIDFPRFVYVSDGSFSVRNWWDSERTKLYSYAVSFPISVSRIQWSRGTTLGDHFVGLSWPRKPCLLIHVDVSQRFFRSGFTCGLNDTMRRRWIAFLKLAGAPERRFESVAAQHERDFDHVPRTPGEDTDRRKR